MGPGEHCKTGAESIFTQDQEQMAGKDAVITSASSTRYDAFQRSEQPHEVIRGTALKASLQSK